MTLSDYIQSAALQDRAGITIVRGRQEETRISYAELYRQALCLLTFFQERGMMPGDEALLQLEEPLSFLVAFWACILGRIIPVPLTIGFQSAQKEKVLHVWKCLKNPWLIVEPSNEKIGAPVPVNEGNSWPEQMERRTIGLPQDWNGYVPAAVVPSKGKELVYLQFSSGSTGTPKGVRLSHDNVVCNIEDIIGSLGISHQDRLLSWMPLTHDMGMIGFHLTGIVKNVETVYIPTSLFIRRPMLWMEKTMEHGTSVLYSPNFGLQYFLSALKRAGGVQLDLSGIRIIVNGAEPISHILCREFTQTLVPYGLQPNVLLPAYGLAEAAVEVTAAKPGAPLNYFSLHRKHLQVGNEVCMVEEADAQAVHFMDVGRPIAHCSVRICSHEDEVFGEGRVGHIQIRGNNVTNGYYNNAEATAAAFTQDGWLRTGDIGCLLDGHLVVTGRHKDVIILHGQNYYPFDIESVLIEAGVAESGKLVALGWFNPASGQEELAVFLLVKGKGEDFDQLAEGVRNVLLRKIGIYPHAILPVKSLPKTTSGKIRRFQLQQRLSSGEFDSRLPRTAMIRESGAGLSPEAVLQVCRVVTGHNGLGEKDNLLFEGLNSIAAMQLVGKIHEQWGLMLRVEDIFEHPSAQELHAYLEHAPAGVFYPPFVHFPSEKWYEASPAQARIWMECMLHPHSTAYHLSPCFNVHGPLNWMTLERAVRLLVQKYDGLRASFHSVDGEVRQQIHDVEEAPASVHYVDGTGKEPWEQQLFLQRQPEDPFDLSQPGLFRVHVVKLARQEYTLLFLFHHIITDGWSLNLLFRELQQLYNSMENGERYPDLVGAPSYLSFVRWQQQLFASELAAQHEAYWKKELAHCPGPVNFFARGMMVAAGAKASSYYYTIDKKKFEQLKGMAMEAGTTPFVIVLALLNFIQYRYGNRKDAVLGFDISGRVLPEMEPLFGYTLNTLCLRASIDGGMRFSELVLAVKEKLYGALENQTFSLERWLQGQSKEGHSGANGLFSTLVLYQNFSQNPMDIHLKDCEISYRQTGVRHSYVETIFEFMEEEDGLLLAVHFSENANTQKEVIQFTEHFLRSVELVAASDEGLRNYDLLTTDEKSFLAALDRTGEADKKHLVPVHLVFEQRAAETPQAIAVESDNVSSTYLEVNRRANNLAHLLRSKGIGRGGRVGFMVNPGVNTIIAILAILKAGAAYVPLDTEIPLARCRQIIQDSAMSCLITDNAWIDDLGAHFPEDFLVNSDDIMLYTLSKENILFDGNISDPAYILYTSGSTGVPKGVVVGHHSLAQYVQQFIDYFEVTGEDVFIQQASVAFDTLVEEIFPALCLSARIVMAPKGNRDIEELLQLISARAVTLLTTTPLVLNEINKQVDSRMVTLRTVISGGDVLHPSYITNLISNVAVYNTYGPTEATVCAAYKKITSLEDAYLIGRPIAQRAIYILDEERQLLPPGKTGEICIGGGLALEYLNQPELTKNSFIGPLPHIANRIYCTGDLGRYTDTGELEFIGRKDVQRKVRGHRVELEEVEKVLLSFPHIAACCVLQQEAGDYLTAFAVVQNSFTEEGLRAYLLSLLPPYMVPYRFLYIDNIPMTTNGKSDRKMLMELIGKLHQQKEELPPALPETREEKLLVEMWEQLLNCKPIGTTDNFFELGGHSIKAHQLHNLIYREWALHLKLSDLFLYPTVKQQAHLIREANQNLYAYIDLS